MNNMNTNRNVHGYKRRLNKNWIVSNASKYNCCSAQLPCVSGDAMCDATTDAMKVNCWYHNSGTAGIKHLPRKKPARQESPAGFLSVFKRAGLSIIP